MNRRSLILSVLALGGAGFLGATWYATRPGSRAVNTVAPEIADALVRSHSPILGNPDAPVVPSTIPLASGRSGVVVVHVEPTAAARPCTKLL